MLQQTAPTALAKVSGYKGSPDDWGAILNTLGSIVAPFIPGGSLVMSGVKAIEQVVSGGSQNGPRSNPASIANAVRGMPGSGLPMAAATAGFQPTPPNVAMPGGARRTHYHKTTARVRRTTRRRRG